MKPWQKGLIIGVGAAVSWILLCMLATAVVMFLYRVSS